MTEFLEKHNNEIVYLSIPSGEFQYGFDGKEYGDSRKTIHLDTYLISEFPITNQLYKYFIDANPSVEVPYLDENWAKDLNWDRSTRMYPSGQSRMPVTMVSYEDIQLYCNWTDSRLPSEFEWEKAAKGCNNNLYPWGFTQEISHLNSREFKRNLPTEVDLFPENTSPFGVRDTVGNVWEWTSTEYEYNGIVVRGGSWQMDSNNISCNTRSGLASYYKSTALGWRTVKDER